MGANGAARGSAAAAASLRRRRAGGGSSAAGEVSTTMLQFYTDETPGLRLSPIVVLTMGVGFIAFVGILHAIGKLYLMPRSYE